jgi:hypothetical protein
MTQQTSLPLDGKWPGTKRVIWYTSFDHSAATRLSDITQPHLADTALCIHVENLSTTRDENKALHITSQMIWFTRDRKRTQLKVDTSNNIVPWPLSQLLPILPADTLQWPPNNTSQPQTQISGSFQKTKSDYLSRRWRVQWPLFWLWSRIWHGL